jgi:hypothetical protein
MNDYGFAEFEKSPFDTASAVLRPTQDDFSSIPSSPELGEGRIEGCGVELSNSGCYDWDLTPTAWSSSPIFRSSSVENQIKKK